MKKQDLIQLIKECHNEILEENNSEYLSISKNNIMNLIDKALDVQVTDLTRAYEI